MHVELDQSTGELVHVEIRVVGVRGLTFIINSSEGADVFPSLPLVPRPDDMGTIAEAVILREEYRA